MPCNCDHLEPTERERQQKIAGKLIVYVFKRLNRQIPEWAERAAANVYGNGGPGAPSDTLGFLCDTLRSLNDNVREDIVYGRPKESQCRQLADWWEEHQKYDKRYPQ